MPTPFLYRRSEKATGADADFAGTQVAPGSALLLYAVGLTTIAVSFVPYTALDAVSAERLRGELTARLAEGLGMVIVTHRLGEVWGVATRIAVLAEGRWACDEPRDGALEAFLPRYQGLVGA